MEGFLFVFICKLLLILPFVWLLLSASSQPPVSFTDSVASAVEA
jgi:hypothetical protein